MVQIKNTLTGFVANAKDTDWAGNVYDKKVWQEVGAQPAQPVQTNLAQPLQPAQQPQQKSNVITSSVLSAPQTDLKIEAQKKQDMTSRVLKAYESNPTAIANSAYIQAVAQAKFGRAATADELKHVTQGGAVGGSLKDVLNRFGLLDKTSDFGTGANQKQQNQQPTQQQQQQAAQEAPATAQDFISKAWEQIANAMKPDTTDYSPMQKEISSEQTALATTKSELDTMKSEMDLNNVLEATAIKDIKDKFTAEKGVIENQAIPMSFIAGQTNVAGDKANAQLDKLSNEQLVAEAMNVYKYNTKLIEYNLHAGLLQNAQERLQNAQDIARQSAEDNRQLATMMLQMAQFQNTLDRQEVEDQRWVIEQDFQKAQAGYVYIPTIPLLQQYVKQYGEKAIYTDPTGKKYLRPEIMEFEQYKQQKTFDKSLEDNTPSINEQLAAREAGFGIDDQGNLTEILPKEGESFSSTMGNLTVTAYGSNLWKNGLDVVIPGGKSADVVSPVSGTVTFVGNNGGFGNQIKIKTSDGSEVWLSHLDSIDSFKYQPGTQINVGSIIGKQGNSGDTYGATGVHVDITAKKPDGSFYTPQQIASVLKTGGSSDKLTDDQQKTLNTLRDDVRQDADLKYFTDVRNAYQRIQASQASGVGDLTLLRSFAKLTDPTTGVREEEYASMQLAQGALARLGVTLTKGMINGEQLTPSARKQFKSQALELYNKHKANYDESVSYWSDIAEASDIPVDMLLKNYEAGTKEQEEQGFQTAEDILSYYGVK